MGSETEKDLKSPANQWQLQKRAVLSPRVVSHSKLGWFSNSGNVIWRREIARKGLNSTSGPRFAAQPLVKPVVWFARAVVNWRSRSVAKSAYFSEAATGISLKINLVKFTYIPRLARRFSVCSVILSCLRTITLYFKWWQKNDTKFASLVGPSFGSGQEPLWFLGRVKRRRKFYWCLQRMVNWRLDFLSTSSSVRSIRDKVQKSPILSETGSNFPRKPLLFTAKNGKGGKFIFGWP